MSDVLPETVMETTTASPQSAERRRRPGPRRPRPGHWRGGSRDVSAAAAAQDATPAAGAMKRPNIVMIMSDDVGWGDLGCYGGGAMRGAPTPNLDQLAAEGMRFVNYYGQASCTAGRASFITGRIPIRTALSLVLVPGDPDHLTPETPTVAQFLRDEGYTTVQLGKWHLGDVRGGLPDRQRLRRDVSHAPLLRGRLRLRRHQSDTRLAGRRPGVRRPVEQVQPRRMGRQGRSAGGRRPATSPGRTWPRSTPTSGRRPSSGSRTTPTTRSRSSSTSTS